MNIKRLNYRLSAVPANALTVLGLTLADSFGGVTMPAWVILMPIWITMIGEIVIGSWLASMDDESFVLQGFLCFVLNLVFLSLFFYAIYYVITLIF